MNNEKSNEWLKNEEVVKRALDLSRIKYEDKNFINLSLVLETKVGPVCLETNISNQRWCNGIGAVYGEIYRLLKVAKIPHDVVHNVLYDLDKLHQIDVDSKGNLYLMNLEKMNKEIKMFDLLSQYNESEYNKLKEVFEKNIVLANKDNGGDIYFEIPVIPIPFSKTDIEYLRGIDIAAVQYIGDGYFETIDLNNL